MTTRSQLQRLKQALKAHRQAIEELEAALSEVEATLPENGEAKERFGSQGLQLRSIVEVYKTMGLGKMWT